jgi:uncharacterized MnhB-related membrane protein
MTWPPELFLMLAVLVAGFMALRLKDLLASVVLLSTYSFFMAILFTAMGAVDVGFMEAVVGAGVTGVLFVAALFRLGRKATK